MNEKKILILFFHPRFEDSRVNTCMVQAIKQIDGITFRDMYEIYPDFNIDIDEEQKFLLEHDVIIWQHPFYWYSCPPLMKQWIDLVLEYGWAYGTGGTQLTGKWIMNVISSGGTFDVYSHEGRNRFTYREFLSPFDQTAHLCHMEYLPPFIIPGANKIEDVAKEQFADRYREIVHFLQRGNVNVQELKTIEYFNQLNFEQWQDQFFKTH